MKHTIRKSRFQGANLYRQLYYTCGADLLLLYPKKLWEPSRLYARALLETSETDQSEYARNTTAWD